MWRLFDGGSNDVHSVRDFRHGALLISVRGREPGPRGLVKSAGTGDAIVAATPRRHFKLHPRLQVRARPGPICADLRS